MPTFAELGLNVKQWSDWRKSMIMTGTYDPNEWDKLNSYQKQWTADTLNTLKAIEEETRPQCL